MTYDELLSAICTALPETDGKLYIEKINYCKESNHAVFSFLSDVLVGERSFLKIKEIIGSSFPSVSFSVRVASPSLAGAFLRDPNANAGTLNTFLVRNFPSCAGWEFDFQWAAKNGKIYLEVPDDFCLQFMKGSKIEEILQKAIYDIFRLDTNVVLQVRGDQDKRLAEMRKEREMEESLSLERTRAISERESEKAMKVPEKSESNQIMGRKIVDPSVPICELMADNNMAIIEGKLLSFETKEISGGEGVLLTFTVTDYTDTAKCKAFKYYRARNPRKDETEKIPEITAEERQKVTSVIDRFKIGMGIKVKGICQYDNFSKENVIMVRDAMKFELPVRTDNEPEKRIELHCHTQFSTMDACAAPSDIIKRAAEWGHEAIAITDHGVAQAYPEAFGAAKKNNIKLIPGVEGYLTDDDDIVIGEGKLPIDTPVVVLDFETTGLNTAKDRIIEIGAVKLSNGQVIESFGELINPGIPLPARISEITHITEQMLEDKPRLDEVMPRFLEFLDGCPIAAHNAKFDCSVLQSELKRLNLPEYTAAQIDTLTLARKLYPELRTHRLSSVCKHLGVSLKDAHRAVNDAAATAQCLAKMISDAKKKGAEKLEDLNDVSKEYTLGNSWHIVLLAATQDGLTNINHMISESHLNYFRRKPHIPRAILQKYREGVIVGSACESGELYTAMVDGANDETLRRIARFYDYLEIQPIGNNEFLIRDGRVADEEQLRENNRRIVELGEKIGLPVVATGDVHFLDPQDSVFRAILQASQGFKDADFQPPLYFKTTGEMLEEFSYLGKEKAHEVVIDAPKMIADRIGKISLFPPHPEGKTTFSPFWETAEDDIKNMTWNKAHELYGDELPELVQKRIDKELGSIIGYGYATLYSIANKLVTKSLNDGYVVGSRGSVGSSFVAFLTGITEVNALPPHYRCTKCRKAWFDIPPQYTIGVDLPDKKCPECGQDLVKDGFDIPFEVFLGFKGDKVPDIDLNFSGEYQPTAHAYVKELFGEKYVYRAGTIGTVAEKTAFGYVLKYLEERGRTASQAEKERLAAGCVGVKRTTGQHPAGMVVLPKAYDICQFTAVQHPADDLECGITTTHYDFSSMHDILVKLDILGHDDPTMLHMLEGLTGINYKNIPLGDKGVMSLFSSPEALGVTPDDLGGCKTGTLGVPEFGTAFVRQMLEDTHPSTMQELIRISGLSHGTDVWLGNAKDLIDNGIAPLSQCLCTRDDIMNQLMQMGVPAKMAFDTMEFVRKGKGLKPEMADAMHEHNVPSWFEDSCRKIKYMFPKGHAVAYVTMALRVAWYKVYRPLAYYAAYFTIRGDGFDGCTMVGSLEHIRNKMREINELDQNKQATQRDKEAMTALEMVQEMMARGFEFLPCDLYKSDVKNFLMEDGKLRIPFTSLSGLGESVAQAIVEARSTPFISIEDLRIRGKVSASIIDLLREQGCLKGLAETSQVSFF